MTMGDLSLIGGRPALDFVNTGGGERNGPPERIGSYADLLAWSRHAGVLADDALVPLERAAADDPDAAAAVVERALALREALYRIFTAAADGRAPEASDRVRLEDEVAEALRHRRLVPTDGRFGWRFEGGGDRLDRPLWTVADDAAELLTSDLLARVKECRGDRCTWLFLDESRNRSRRWCDMGDCGNRAKVRRYRKRHGG